MSSKKSDDLEKVPSVMLSKDDVMSRPPSTGGKKQKPNKSEDGNGSPSTSPLTALILVLLVAAVAFLYYQLYEERQKMRANEIKLEQTLMSLNQLGSQLNVQDQALSETGGNVEKRLLVLDSEVRKLWALSNKKNKQSILSNAKKVSEQKKGLDWLSKKMKATEKKLDTQSVALDKMSKQLEETKQRLTSLDAIEKKAAQLEKQVVLLSKSDNKAVVASLEGRIEELELSIAAIDAHRAQVNRNLDQVRQELARLSGGG